MPQSYFYNGQQIDTFTDIGGSAGVLVSTFQHDSSPEVSLIQQAVARAGGTRLMDVQTRAKTITMTGTIEGTSQADFEKRITAFKQLFQNPRGALKVTNYEELEYRVAIFEEGEAWVKSLVQNPAVDDAPLWDFTNYKVGRRGLIVEATTTSGARDAYWSGLTLDLSSFTDADTVKLWAYVPDHTKLASIKLGFEVDGSNKYEKTWNSAFTTGWNELTVLRSALTTTGSPSWSTLTAIRLTVTASGTSLATITFDDLRISTTAQSLTYQATLSSPIDIRREHYHTTWCPFSLTFTVPDGLATSDRTASVRVNSTTKPQRFLTRYLSGSGTQPFQLTSIVGSAIPSAIQVSDHFTDTFATYQDTRSTTEHGYWLSVSTFETNETWTGGAADTVNVKVGTQGRKLTATASATVLASRTVTADYLGLPNTHRTKVWVYVDNATNLASVDLFYQTTSGVDYYTKNVTGLVTGWNLVSVKKRDFTAGGSPSWGTITELTIQATANGSGTVNVTFDDWRWEDALNCTGGNYTTTGDWEIAEVGAYPSAIVCHGDGTALLKNRAMVDGEIIALYRANGTNSAGFIARGSIVGMASFGQYPSLTLGSSTVVTSNIGIPTGYTGAWMWLRLVCTASLVQLFYRPVTSDSWTKCAEGATTVMAAGAWGLYAADAGGGPSPFASVEVIDHSTPQSNTLHLLGGPFTSSLTAGKLHLDTQNMIVREGTMPGTVSGGFPTFSSGFNEGVIVHPSAVIGTDNFRYANNYMTNAVAFGDTAVPKVGIPISTGSQTYVRQRGSFIYLGKFASYTQLSNVVVRIETDTAGAPSGTLVNASATVTIPSGDVRSYYDGSGTYNASWTPYELLWPADFPIPASSTIWVVVSLSGAETTQMWAIGAKSDSGANNVKVYDSGTSSWITFTSSGNPKSGYAILATNNPAADISTPWYDTQSYTPCFR